MTQLTQIVQANANEKAEAPAPTSPCTGQCEGCRKRRGGAEMERAESTQAKEEVK